MFSPIYKTNNFTDKTKMENSLQLPWCYKHTIEKRPISWLFTRNSPLINDGRLRDDRLIIYRFYFGHGVAFFKGGRGIKKRSPGEAIDRTGFRSRANQRASTWKRGTRAHVRDSTLVADGIRQMEVKTREIKGN